MPSQRNRKSRDSRYEIAISKTISSNKIFMYNLYVSDSLCERLWMDKYWSESVLVHLFITREN